MTTIVGVEDFNGSVIVADAITTSDNRPYSSFRMAKIVQREQTLIAAAGSVHACDLVQYLWLPPYWDGVTDIPSFTRSMIVPSLKQFLSAADWQPDAEKDDILVLLIAVAGALVQINEDYSVLHRADGLYAIGSGAAYAIGALEAGATPTEAVEIASRNDVMTGLPTQTIKQEKRDD